MRAPKSFPCEGHRLREGKPRVRFVITYQRLGKYVTAEPFRPFRIRMASGQMLDVRHPEMIAVSRSSAHIHFSMSDDPNEAPMGVREVSLLLMESVEPIDAPLATDAQ